MISDFYFPYPGSKRKEYTFIRDYIPNDINIFVEPFAGTAAISRFYYFDNHKNIDYHINDIDNFLISLYTRIKNKNINHIFDELKKYDGISKEDYNNIVKNRKNHNYSNDEDILNELMLFCICQMRAGRYPSKKYFLDNRIKHLKNNINNDFFEKNNVIITLKDYKNIFEQYKDNEKAFLFLDPPYNESYNGDYINSKSSCVADIYENIYNFFISCKCKIMMVVNDSFYNRIIFKNYIKHSYNKKYEMSKKELKHLIITNY
jgi:site-specific DNA-adenine methylase